MKKLLAILFAIVVSVAILAILPSGILTLKIGIYKSYPTPEQERPVINIPFSLQQANWIGNRGEGSCVHASMVSLLRWQGQMDMARYWRRTYQNGEWAERLAGKLDRENVRYAYVTNGDVRFLEWACSTRRGCNITVRGGRHMITLVHLDDEWAATLDNNDTGRFRWLPRKALVAEWQASNGWAVTPVYSPAAPLPG